MQRTFLSLLSPVLIKASHPIDGYSQDDPLTLSQYNLEAILATVRAAEAKKSPAMILLFPWAMQYLDRHLVQAAAQMCRSAKVPMTLHLDHCQTPELVRQAADIPDGFDSIMVDMSHYEKEENLRLTKELVAYCTARGIATEAEPGRIEGGEDGVADTADLEGLLTDPAEAQEFVDTGITWLAPAIGNVHGNYGPRGIQLEYDRVENIVKQIGTDVQLVLHGTDSFSEEILHKCIDHGFTKINMNKVVNREYVKVQQEKAGKAALTAVIEEGTDAMQKQLEKLMDWMRSSGKAA